MLTLFNNLKLFNKVFYSCIACSTRKILRLNFMWLNESFLWYTFLDGDPSSYSFLFVFLFEWFLASSLPKYFYLLLILSFTIDFFLVWDDPFFLPCCCGSLFLFFLSIENMELNFWLNQNITLAFLYSMV